MLSCSSVIELCRPQGHFCILAQIMTWNTDFQNTMQILQVNYTFLVNKQEGVILIFMLM